MITMQNACFTYEAEGEAGIHDITLHIPEGQCVLLTGASGCGKTTLIRLLNGLIPRFYSGELNGRICIEGKEVEKWDADELSAKVGSVFQNPRSQFFNLDTTSEIAFGCENLGWSREEIRRRVQETAADLGISHLLDRNIFSLSGGEKQMVAIASAYAMGADIFVMDEPSANLDTVATEQLAKTIARLKVDGKTLIIAEHRLYYLRGLADRILYMEKGRIQGDWTEKEFLALTAGGRMRRGLRSYDLQAMEPEPRLLLQDREADFFIEDLWAAYPRSEPVLSGVTCKSAPGEVIAVIGRNGQGKSTFARCLCGLIKEMKGKIRYKGNIAPYKKRIGRIYLVMQDSTCQLFGDSVIGELTLSRSANDGCTDTFDRILGWLSLEMLRDRHPMSLSGGEKQRLAIAAGIVRDSDIMILDEPTSGLDYDNMQRVKEVLEMLRKDGKHIFVITHDYEFLLTTCDRVLEIEDGKVCRDYPVNAEHLQELRRFFLESCR